MSRLKDAKDIQLNYLDLYLLNNSYWAYYLKFIHATIYIGLYRNYITKYFGFAILG